MPSIDKKKKIGLLIWFKFINKNIKTNIYIYLKKMSKKKKKKRKEKGVAWHASRGGSGHPFGTTHFFFFFFKVEGI
jgi:hypothetical protein